MKKSICRVCRTLEQGDSVGEDCVHDPKLRTASVIAVEWINYEDEGCVHIYGQYRDKETGDPADADSMAATVGVDEEQAGGNGSSVAANKHRVKDADSLKTGSTGGVAGAITGVGTAPEV